MKTGIKVLCTVSGILILVGMILAVMGLIFGGGLESDPAEPVTLHADGEFNKISVDAGITDITVKKSDTGKSYAVCDASKKISYSLKIENGTLYLSETDARKWYDFIGISFGSRSAILYLNEGVYESLNISTASGSIFCENENFSFNSAEFTALSGGVNVEKLNTGELIAKASSGGINIKDTNCKNITAKTASGRLVIEGCSVQGTIGIKASSGGIRLKNISAENLIAEASSGQIKLSDSSSVENITLTTSSGSIKVNDSTATQKAEISSSSGSVSLSGFDAYDIFIETSSGSVRGELLTGKIFEVRTSSGSASYPDSSFDGGFCKVTTSSGSVKIEIKE